MSKNRESTAAFKQRMREIHLQSGTGMRRFTRVHTALCIAPNGIGHGGTMTHDAWVYTGGNESE